MRVTRRHLLALAAGTSAAALVSGSVLVSRWWDAPPDAPYRGLSEEEGAFLRAWSGAAFPPTSTLPLDGASAGLDHFFDALLGHTPEDTGRLLRLLLNGLDAATVPLEGDVFHRLSVDQQARHFKTWTHSRIDHFRSAAQSLVLLLGMGWSTHPEVAPHMKMLHSCGYGT